MAAIKRILVVCTGNACRSPMAEGFLKQYLKPENGFEVISAGISAIAGLVPTPEAVEVMKEEDIDISSYSSNPFSEEFAKAADIILVMSKMHKELISERLPEARDKVCLYKEFAKIEDKNGVDDPIGQSIAVYRRVRDEIRKATLKIVEKIKKENLG
ncbi:MAG: low molecular weight protein arginine phosphatase [Candidatus Omnitrophica bacterium]|nr:low molecular weight protein arginine phosphatase [Candidatus Omnitrophota bacterium]